MNGIILNTKSAGIAGVTVENPGLRMELPWDRYIRLAAAARAIRELSTAHGITSILDVGGSDGALALFLPEYQIDLIDPATTGGDIALVDAGSYDAVCAVDVVEHVEPRLRTMFITHIGRIARKACVVNCPLPSTITAQKVVAALTDNPFVIEHVKFGLPYCSTIHKQFEDIGFFCRSGEYGSMAVWVTYMTLQQASPEKAATVARYLLEEHEQDQAADPLYGLSIAVRKQKTAG